MNAVSFRCHHCGRIVNADEPGYVVNAKVGSSHFAGSIVGHGNRAADYYSTGQDVAHYASVQVCRQCWQADRKLGGWLALLLFALAGFLVTLAAALAAALIVLGSR